MWASENGHVDVVERASRLFARVVVAVAANPDKRPLFSQAQRRKLVDQAVGHLPNVDVAAFSGLLVDFAAKRGACAIIRASGAGIMAPAAQARQRPSGTSTAQPRRWRCSAPLLHPEP